MLPRWLTGSLQRWKGTPCLSSLMVFKFLYYCHIDGPCLPWYSLGGGSISWKTEEFYGMDILLVFRCSHRTYHSENFEEYMVLPWPKENLTFSGIRFAEITGSVSYLQQWDVVSSHIIHKEDVFIQSSGIFVQLLSRLVLISTFDNFNSLSKMAILTVIHTEILCLSCDRRVCTPWKSYMWCSHVLGTWKFLRIGAGFDKVRAAFCIICPSCLEDMPPSDEAEIDRVRREATSKLSLDTMLDIERQNEIVIIDTLDRVKDYLVLSRPWIEVDRSVRAGVQAPIFK